MDNKITFKGPAVTGETTIEEIELVSVPSKPRYSVVDICIRDGWNIAIGEIKRSDLPFEDAKKIGKEIERRWNFFKNHPEYLEKLNEKS